MEKIMKTTMKTDLLNQLKAHLNMNKDTHGAFVKRKWLKHGENGKKWWRPFV